jgi:hypothetical protein
MSFRTPDAMKERGLPLGVEVVDGHEIPGMPAGGDHPVIAAGSLGRVPDAVRSKIPVFGQCHQQIPVTERPGGRGIHGGSSVPPQR